MSKLIEQRRLDELGRLVIPKGLRIKLGIQTNSLLNIYLDDGSIILKRNLDKSSCALCGESESELTEVGDKHICSDCIAKIKGI